MGKRGGEVLRDHNAFAGRERVVLNHVRRPKRLERFLGLGWRSSHSGLGGRDAPGCHDLLGEGFRPLNPCPGRVRPESRDPRTAHGVGDARDERRLRPDHDQIRPDMLCHADNIWWTASRDGMYLRQRRDAGIPRRRMKLADTGVRG
jgi:hypothetical protein